MDEAWEKAVEAALEGNSSPVSEIRVLNLDGAVKSLHGCLPRAVLLERFLGLEHLSIANVGAQSLDRFPRLRNLQRLILSDNRISGGLESLVDAGLHALRDLDLSNNRIHRIEDLAPLARLHLVSLDLYECPVTRAIDYRSRVFSMLRSLKYLDKLDADENERPETDDEEEEEDEEDEYDDEEDDPGSGEVDGDVKNGTAGKSGYDDEGIVDEDEGEESDADEELEAAGRGAGRGSDHHQSNVFRADVIGTAASIEADEQDENGDGADDAEEDNDDLGEEIDEDAYDEDNVVDSEDEEDGADEIEDRGIDIGEDDDEDEEEVDEDDAAEPVSANRHAGAEGEIDEHDHGEDDGNGEIGEEDGHSIEGRDVEEEGFDESEEDDLDDEYLIQPIARSSGQYLDAKVDKRVEFQPSRGASDHGSSSNSAPNRRRRDEGDQLDDQKTKVSRPTKRH